MEFSSIGAEDSLEEAKSRLNGNDALVVWGQEKILGVLTEEHLEKSKVTAVKFVNWIYW